MGFVLFFLFFFFNILSFGLSFLILKFFVLNFLNEKRVNKMV